MTIPKLTLSILPEVLGICRFDEKSPIPDWAKDISFCSITRTADELSVVCPQDEIPAGVLAEKNRRAFKVEGPLGFSLTGIVSSLSKPLAEAGISIFYISTYETDYLLVEEKNLAKAVEVLSAFCEIRK
ncbi:MAG: ACT domain-containing protein [Candidatus Nealsonbacteria bacterium CG09_land_8_20_14_0_10_42_14]|uniref:ACT domain-containing protein n=1 Tax=Candidatus Nealsonbacteria bacterium CG09_land_8_20_14_0_10_42_14 TaxID=1974707 RepID=A0A2H0WX00_9BACT|nr:MAG: ACT domain-containing protein [Candidatus Nealsonbacteria bacterium CG09_land_8_20_14_0_10_42_14]